jgi:hypothetical protein
MLHSKVSTGFFLGLLKLFVELPLGFWLFWIGCIKSFTITFICYFSNLFHFLILQIVSIRFEFMDTYWLKELHNTRFDDVVINELESLILSKKVLQEIKAIADEKWQVEEEVFWRQQ